MVRKRNFPTDALNDFLFLGMDEEPIIIGKFHWLVWVTPVLITALVGVVGAFWGSNVRVIAAVALLVAVVASRVGAMRKLGLPWILLLVGLLVVLAERYEGFLAWLFVGLVMYSGFTWLDYRWTTFVLTTGRIVRRSGIFTTQTATMNLRALTDIRLDETVMGQLFGYGHFMVESAGQEQAFTELRFVPEPEFFYQLVMTVALGKTPNRDHVRDLPPGWSFG